MTLFIRNSGLRLLIILTCLCAGLSSTSSASEEDGGTAAKASKTPVTLRYDSVREQRGARRKQSDQFSNILLYTQHGKAVRFYDNLVKNKVVMINLMYTTCPQICPANSARLMKVHELLEEWMGQEITMLSLSIDPEIDTPQRLKRYWEVFGSKPGWLFLTGDYDEIDGLRRELGVYDLDPVIDADKTQHSGIITFGNDRTDRWAALPLLMHAQQLAGTILRITWDKQFNRRPSELAQVADKTKTYHGQGILKSVHPDKRQVMIDHEDIPGLMMAMTMMFEVADWAMLEELSADQAIDFSVEYKEGRYTILAIQPRKR